MTDSRLDKATLPATAVLAVAVLFGGWWANAQEERLSDLEDDSKSLREQALEREIEYQKDVAEINQTTAVQTNTLKAIADSIERLEKKIDD